jgi:hypothetical protein
MRASAGRPAIVRPLRISRRFLIIASKSIVSNVVLGNVELDTVSDRGHTQYEMNRVAQALELRTPVTAQLLVLGSFILTVIVILPR